MINMNNATIMDGRKIANQIKSVTKEKIESLNTHPNVAIIVATNNNDTMTFLRVKEKAFEDVGIDYQVFQIPLPDDDLIDTVERHNESSQLITKIIEGTIKNIIKSNRFDGIIMEMPLPRGIDRNYIGSLIPYHMDIDAISNTNIMDLYSGKVPFYAPCLPEGIIRLLDAYEIPMENKMATIFSRSNNIGKPLEMLFLQRNAAVTMLHSKFTYYYDQVIHSDIIVGATGSPNSINLDGTGADTLIDAGCHYMAPGMYAGDFNLDSIRDSWTGQITPVPGGTGPMTVAILIEHALKAHLHHKKLDK